MYNWIFAAASIFCMIWQKKKRKKEKALIAFPFFSGPNVSNRFSECLGVGVEGKEKETADLYCILQIYLFLKA